MTVELASDATKVGRREIGASPLGPIALVLAAATAAAAVGAPFVDHPSDHLTAAIRAALVVAFAAGGVAAVVHRPFERQGFLVVVGATCGGVATICSAVLAAHSSGGLVDLSRVAEPIALALLPVVTMHVLLGLPDGSCRLSRTAILFGYVFGLAVGLYVWSRRPALPLWPLGVEALLVVPVGIVGSVRRYSKSRGVERQRMQWFGWAVAVGVELLLLALAGRLMWGWPTRFYLVVAVAALPLAAAITLGSSRRFAGRIDRILAHTVSLAGLTAVVVAVYLIIVVGLGRTPTRSDRSLVALSMVAAAVSALLYPPARRRLSLYANRVAYGEREAPDNVLRTFGSRLSRAVPMEELLLQVAESLRKTLGLAAAEVWTGGGGHFERTVSVPDSPVIALAVTKEEESVVARAGASGTAWVQIWLPTLLQGREGSVVRVASATHSGHVLGLIVAVRPPDADQFSLDDDTMLTELARQVGLALHNVELDSALQESLDEVRRQATELQASRARIVAAADAARRKIERDLHDGAQQHLVALAVNLRLARQLAESDPDGSRELLDQLALDMGEAVQQLRALAHGIYPPLLVDRGIGEALQSAAGRAALPTSVEAEGISRHTPDVEAAVYFCCMEAMQNAGKHAGEGATIAVRVWEEPDWLNFEVADTGRGFDTDGVVGKGAGFVNMADRVGAIDGTIRVTSVVGQGTKIGGRIPLHD
ncbi:MAG TPA: histidine kinase [Acidimicrobiales bacterium]|nr:histidine kinase [Acidimicrobiales bacterium]